MQKVIRKLACQPGLRSSLARHSKVRPLQRESQLLLGEGVVVMRLDGVVLDFSEVRRTTVAVVADVASQHLKGRRRRIIA